jgi:antitoxin component of RelBE/YafQ-DinJ toxin-antitoxin module
VIVLTTISIRIDETEKEALQKYAKEQDLTISQAVRKAIKEWLQMQAVVEKLNEIPN